VIDETELITPVELQAARDLGPAHRQMPEEFVKFLTQLWKDQLAKARGGFGSLIVLERKIWFDQILSSGRIATLADRAYQSFDGQRALEAISSRAVSIPEEWVFEDKRNWSDKEAYLKIFNEILDALDKFLTNEKTVGWRTFTPGAFAKRVKRPKVGPWRLLQELSRGGSVAGVLNRESVPSLRTTPSPGNLLRALQSTLIVADQWDNIAQKNRALRPALRYRLSVYELHRIIIAFKAAFPEYVERLRKEHGEGAKTGEPVLRHAATQLNESLEPFASGFKPPTKAIKFSRYRAISDFIHALYGKSFTDAKFGLQRVHEWCRPRRRVPGAGVEEARPGTTQTTANPPIC
jgi:hypothetical protein